MGGKEGGEGGVAEFVAYVAEVRGGPPEEETGGLRPPPLHLRGGEEGVAVFFVISHKQITFKAPFHSLEVALWPLQVPPRLHLRAEQGP